MSETGATPENDIISEAVERMGRRILADATAVPTAEELAALRVILRELDSADMIEHLDKNDAPGWGYPYDAVDTLRAYLERQR